LIIGVDCRKIGNGGIGTYLRNLLAEWQRQDVPAKFLLFHAPGDECLLPVNFGERLPCASPKYSLSELFSFNRPLKERRADLFYSPHYTLPFGLPCPAVVTIHDLIHLKYKSRFGPLGKRYAKFMVGHAVKESRIILTDSEHSKSDIAAISSSHAGKIRVAFPAVDRGIFKPCPRSEAQAFRREKSLPGEFVLYVGALKPHKNPAALSAIARELGFPVVAATRDLKTFEDLLTPDIKLNNLINRVDISGDRELVLLYNAARLLIHPAFYEGFGLPPLEAMACGLPVVCSSASSLPEVVGGAALLFDPNDRRAMLEKVNQCWREAELRDILKKRGLERSEVFSWGETAKKVFELFVEAAGS